MTEPLTEIEKRCVEGFFDQFGHKLRKLLARTLESKAWKHIGKGGNARQRRLKRRHGINL